MGTLEIIRLLDYVVSLASRVGISVAKYQEMRNASGGNLTEEQVSQLAAEADEARERL
jgi:hypothetical protein